LNDAAHLRPDLGRAPCHDATGQIIGQIHRAIACRGHQHFDRRGGRGASPLPQADRASVRAATPVFIIVLRIVSGSL
jgi:hypothetical protein